MTTVRDRLNFLADEVQILADYVKRAQEDLQRVDENHRKNQTWLEKENESLREEVKSLILETQNCCFQAGTYEDTFQDGNSLSVCDMCAQHKRPLPPSISLTKLP